MESPSADIESYMEDNNCTINEAINELVQWNKEDSVDRLDARAANILSYYKSTFKWDKVEEE